MLAFWRDYWHDIFKKTRVTSMTRRLIPMFLTRLIGYRRHGHVSLRFHHFYFSSMPTAFRRFDVEKRLAISLAAMAMTFSYVAAMMLAPIFPTFFIS